MVKARPIAEYREEMGDVLWWKFPITEAPYVGSPNTAGYAVESTLRAIVQCEVLETMGRMFVGGWPGYHTHFTPIEIPDA